MEKKYYYYVLSPADNPITHKNLCSILYRVGKMCVSIKIYDTRTYKILHTSIHATTANGISNRRVVHARVYVFTQTGCSHATLTDEWRQWWYTAGVFFFFFTHTYRYLYDWNVHPLLLIRVIIRIYTRV